MLTVDTKANGYSYEQGPSLIGSLGLFCQYKRFLSCLGCSCQPCTKCFFPHCTLFHIICPHRPASLARSRAASPVYKYVSLLTHSVSAQATLLYTDLFDGRIRGQKGIIHDLFFRRNFLYDNCCTGPKNIIRVYSN